MTNSFLKQSGKTLQEKELSTYHSFYQMADKWDKLVQSVADDGYGDYLVEFDNDFWIRKDLERILDSKSLEIFDEFHQFKRKVQETDDKLKALFLPNVSIPNASYWWREGVLKNGYDYYASDLLEIYGIEIPGGKP